ncbi:MAG TPA: ATP-binding cassette domain-containing protein [Polyangiaceae bacterium LLY-WYZ-14_1]|nr:ATP-binding cassette domain-containing protein [Polyangiaceae bacterium LLY-WYZ-14_1]
MNDVMISARDLTKRYGDVTALDRATFEVRRGEVLGFLGPNGAGKTTTMKMLTCFIAPTEGTAQVNGADVFEDPMNVRASIGYLPESTPLYREMLVLEYLEWVTEMRGMRGDRARQRIKTVVEQTRLGDVISKRIGELSKGFRQRVGLAQALMHEPPILILDEPMSGLDPNQATEIRELIKDIGRERTVILSTHNLAEVQIACNRVLIVSKGKIVADDTPEDLRRRAGRAKFIARFLGPDAADGEKRIRDALGSLPGVDSVNAAGKANGELPFELIPKGDEDLRPLIFKAAVDAGATLVELRREGQNLESIFRQLTTLAEGGDKSVAERATPKVDDGASAAASKDADTAGDAAPAEEDSAADADADEEKKES